MVLQNLYDKESLINNSQHFNKTNSYLSPQILAQPKRPGHLTMEILVLTLDRHKNVVI